MTELLKLNLGCGDRHHAGYLNVDREDFYKPEFKWDLEETPWPWEDNSVGEVLLIQVLEHLGADLKTYFNIIKELYRVCAPDARIHIEVPHWRHDNFLHDPTHVRRITDVGLAMFSQKRNLENCGAETKLGMILGVDFEIMASQFLLEPSLEEARKRGEVNDQMIQHFLNTQNNVAYDAIFELRVVKPATSLLPKKPELTGFTWR